MSLGLDNSESSVWAGAGWGHSAERFPLGQTDWRDSLQGIEWGSRMVTVVCEGV